MYRITDASENVRLDPAGCLRPVFKSKLQKAWKLLQTPAAFSEWLNATKITSQASAHCSPLELFLRKHIPRKMDVHAAGDSVTIADWNHPGPYKPTAELDLPSWVGRFMEGYFEAWQEYYREEAGTSDYILGGIMPYDAQRRLLDQSGK